MTKVIYKNAFYVYLHVDLLLLTMPMIYQRNIVVINYVCSSVKMTACLFIFTIIILPLYVPLFERYSRNKNEDYSKVYVITLERILLNVTRYDRFQLLLFFSLFSFFLFRWILLNSFIPQIQRNSRYGLSAYINKRIFPLPIRLLFLPSCSSIVVV